MKIISSNQVNRLIKLPHIDRLIHTDFFNHVQKASEISILYGPRQVGKSQEIYTCIQELLSNPVHMDVFFYNLDLIPEEFESPELFITTLQAQKSFPQAKTWVFLDEAQRLANVGLFAKYIHDLNSNIKFILCGSASLEIKAKVKEPLTGRKKEFYLSPLTLREIFTFKGLNPLQISAYFPQLGNVLEEYLLFGGYPEVVITPSRQQKIDKLLEIAETYTLKDTADFFGFDSPKVIQIVARFLAENIGNLLSLDNISQATGIPRYQTQKALEALEKSFIVKLVPPLAKTPAKELTHQPKVFFIDTGVRNALLHKLEPSLIAADKGQLFENTIATELSTLYGTQNLRFWRTTNQTEVDFVVMSPSDTAQAFEAKYAWEKEPRLPKNLHSLQRQYPDFIREASVISKTNFWKLYA